LKKRVTESSGSSSRRTAELEEKVILLSAEVQRLRSNESTYEGSKQKLNDYENK